MFVIQDNNGSRIFDSMKLKDCDGWKRRKRIKMKLNPFEFSMKRINV